MFIAHCPDWARSVADETAVLVRTPEVMDRFRNHIKTWARKFTEGWSVDNAESFSLRTKRRGPWQDLSWGPNNTMLIPVGMPDEATKYAILAAIHDQCVDGPPINPWWTHGTPMVLDFEESIAHDAYWGLMLDVADSSDWNVPESSRIPIENVLREIVASCVIGQKIDMMNLTPEDLAQLRRAIRQAGGKKATTARIVKATDLQMNRKKMLAGLRILEANGEYSGFARKPRKPR